MKRIQALVLVSTLLSGCGVAPASFVADGSAVHAAGVAQGNGFREVVRYERIQETVEKGVANWFKAHPKTDVFPSGTWPVASLMMSTLKVRPDGQGFEAAGDGLVFARANVYAINDFAAAFHLRMNARGEVTSLTYQKDQKDQTPAAPAPRFQALGGDEAKSVVNLYVTTMQQSEENLFYFFSNKNAASLLQTGACGTNDPKTGFTEDDTLLSVMPQAMTIPDGRLVQLSVKWRALYKTGHTEEPTADTSVLLLDANGRIIRTFPRPY